MALHLNLGQGVGTGKNLSGMIHRACSGKNTWKKIHLQILVSPTVFLHDVTAHKFLLNKPFSKTRKFKGKEFIALSYAEWAW